MADGHSSQGSHADTSYVHSGIAFASDAREGAPAEEHVDELLRRLAPASSAFNVFLELEQAEADLDRELAVAAQHQPRDRLRLLQGGRSKIRTSVRRPYERGGRKTS